MNCLEMATAERTDLADFLATLTPEQWEAPSLCEGWRVRDVVAHVMSFDGVSLLGMFRRAIRGRIVHINQVGVDELASLSYRTAPPPAAGSSAATGAGHNLRGPARPARRHHPSSGHPPPAWSATPDPG